MCTAWANDSQRRPSPTFFAEIDGVVFAFLAAIIVGISLAWLFRAPALIAASLGLVVLLSAAIFAGYCTVGVGVGLLATLQTGYLVGLAIVVATRL
jgi:hypothetical protein